jgi:hypothetical protein
MGTALANVTLPVNLSVDTANQVVLDDGVDTATYTLTGAPGEVVNLTWQGVLVINKGSLTLDGGGSGSFVIGPYAAGFITDANGVNISCQYENDIADGVICNVVVE